MTKAKGPVMEQSLLCSWEEDRKYVLRGWSLFFIILATLLVFSVVDGRMVYMQGPLTGYVGFWTNCKKHKCANMGQVTVLIHMSKGFIMLSLALALVLITTMLLSFRPVFRRLNKIDFVFSFLSISTGFLIFLSLTLFVVNCEKLRPRPQVSYLLTFYLCWCASGLMLWAGALSYLNQVGAWKPSTPLEERRLSYRRWTIRHSSVGCRPPGKAPDSASGHIYELPCISSFLSDTWASRKQNSHFLGSDAPVSLMSIPLESSTSLNLP